MKTTAIAVIALALAQASHASHASLMPRHRDPVTLTERGSSALLFLETHRRAGTPSSRAELRRDARWLVRAGLRRAGVLSGFVCIHRYEGPWHHDANPKYDGGLQMDRSFQSSYGAAFVRKWGTADRWPTWAQLVAGYRAVRARGWSPWPNTARACGLL